MPTSPASGGEGAPRLRVAVLGPVAAHLDGEAVVLGGPKQRAVLAALALGAGRPAGIERIIDLVWDDDPPDGAAATVRTYVANLRRQLEPERARRHPPQVLRSVGTGYELALDEVELDLARFRAAQAAVARSRDWAVTAAAADEASALWRGPAFADLVHIAAFDRAARRLADERLDTEAAGVEAHLALGHLDEVVARSRALLADQPFREPVWGLLATALYRSGRQADALAALAEARELLVEHLGIEPGTGLREVEQAVLQQAPSPTPSRGRASAVPEDHATVAATRVPAMTASVATDDGRELALGRQPVTIGRAGSCGLVVADGRASREHAVLEPIGGVGWQVRDLGSLNGTFLNGEPVPVARLADGDRIEIGSSALTFRTA